MKSLPIILLQFISVSSQLIHFDENNDKFNMIANIISSFKHFGIMFHCDNYSKTAVDILHNAFQIDTMTVIFNYDVVSTQRIRPSGYKYIHIIILDDINNFYNYTDHSIFQLSNTDILLLIINLNTNKMIKTFSLGNNSVYAAARFVLNVTDNTLYSVCSLCGLLTGNWQLVGNFTDNETFYPNFSTNLNKVYQQHFSDYNGHKFNVGYATYHPFFWCR